MASKNETPGQMKQRHKLELRVRFPIAVRVCFWSVVR